MEGGGGGLGVLPLGPPLGPPPLPFVTVERGAAEGGDERVIKDIYINIAPQVAETSFLILDGPRWVALSLLRSVRFNFHEIACSDA